MTGYAQSWYAAPGRDAVIALSTGGATGGVWRLWLGNESTDNLSFNASAADIAAAINGLVALTVQATVYPVTATDFEITLLSATGPNVAGVTFVADSSDLVGGPVVVQGDLVATGYAAGAWQATRGSSQLLAFGQNGPGFSLAPGDWVETRLTPSASNPNYIYQNALPPVVDRLRGFSCHATEPLLDVSSGVYTMYSHLSPFHSVPGTSPKGYASVVAGAGDVIVEAAVAADSAVAAGHFAYTRSAAWRPPRRRRCAW